MNRKRLIHILIAFNLLLIGSLLFSLPGPANVQAAAPVEATSARHLISAARSIPQSAFPHASDRLLIKLHPGNSLQVLPGRLPSASQPGLQHTLAALNLRSARPLGRAQTYILRLAPDSDPQAALDTLAKDPAVEWVEPDYLAQPIRSPHPAVQTTPNDPIFAQQWGLTQIQAPAAWDVVTGSSSTIIAVIDSGIDFAHPDLVNKLWTNPGEIPANGLDDDNNGFIDDVKGWDFVNDDNNPADDEGHGTQVAGVAAAASNNTLGIAGMCWDCRLMPVKVMHSSGVANYSDIAAGVLYAAQKGARVINISLGGYSPSSALHEAIQSAVNDYGAVVVAGAGNDNQNDPFFPAAYPEALAVAGIDPGSVKTAVSNYGDWVDVAAPAQAIHTTFMGGSYGPVDGTSFAASFAAGLAGLLRSQHSTWTPALVSGQIIHTAAAIDVQNPAFAGLLGSGRINAASAVTVNPHPILNITASAVNGDPLGRPEPGSSVTLQITLKNAWMDAASVVGALATTDPYVAITQGSASFGSLPAGTTAAGSSLFTFNIASGAGYNHPILFNLHLSANSGTYTVDLPLTITTRSPDQSVGGTIAVNTTWTNDKTYLVTNNLGVAPGVTLTIQAGTVIKFNGNYSLNVGGALIADGTQGQPIRFLSNTTGSWGRIYFDDPSQDARSDASGSYLGGNLLRWVLVQGASQGIACNMATPYISHITTDGGGMNCTTSGEPLWLLDSQLNGYATVNVIPWRSRASVPSIRAGSNAAAANNGKIYVIGGFDYYSTIEPKPYFTAVDEYDPATDTWTTKSSMSIERVDLGIATANNGKIYAIGGRNYTGCLDAVEEYDPATDSWTTRSSMPTTRADLGGVAANNGKIYAIGGKDNGGNYLATVEEYDPATNTWTAKASMPTPRAYLGVSAANNGMLYAIGGYNTSGVLATVEEYNPATDTWTVKSAIQR